jgi:hypothetical protein
VKTETWEEEEREKSNHTNLKTIIILKSKAVPLHAIEAHGGRGGIAPTHT